jgi:hypothetical protein
VAELTAEIDAALRRVTLNFASEARARRAVEMAAALAAIVDAPPSLDHERPLASEAELALRVERATDALSGAPPEVVLQADTLVARVSALQTRLAARHVALADLQISPRLRHGLRFVLRESAVTAAALPAAMLGRLAHWIPLRLARTAALRSLRRDPSRDQPAMRTMLLGIGLVSVWYLSIGALVMRRFGPLAALLGLALLVSCARVDFLLRDRMHRAYQRARTYLALRADPALRVEALEEIRSLRAEASALDDALSGAPAPAP